TLDPINNILCKLNGITLFGGPIADSSLGSGAVALYSWASQGVMFDQIQVRAPSWTTNLPTTNLTPWSIVDLGTVSSPSDWKILSGKIRQDSNIYGPDPSATDHRLGTYCLWRAPEALA